MLLSVEDDGPGIEPTLRKAVLNRGTRADTATAGQGIGLSVVADLVSIYGGELDIQSGDLGGALMSVTLPT